MKKILLTLLLLLGLAGQSFAVCALKSGNVYTCLSTDPRPVASEGTRLYETNAADPTIVKLFIYQSGAWKELTDHDNLTDKGTNTHGQIDSHVGATTSVHNFDGSGRAPAQAHDHTAADGSGVLTNDVHDGYIDIKEIVEPGAPGLDTLRLYATPRLGRTVLRYQTQYGTKFQLGQDQVMVVRNETGVTIPAFYVVYESGTGAGGEPLVSLARADSDTTMPALGMMLESVPTGFNGFVMLSGVWHGLPTSGYSAGDILYVSQNTAGILTATEPPHPNLKQRMARVLASHPTDGVIRVVSREERGNHEGTNRNSWKVGDATGGAKSVQFVAGGTGSLAWDPTGPQTVTIPNNPNQSVTVQMVEDDIADARVTVSMAGAPETVASHKDFLDLSWSAGVVSGGGITDNGDGTVSIAAGEAMLRTAPSETAPLLSTTFPEALNIALTNNSANYIYVAYNAGASSIEVTTSLSDFNCIDKCHLYTIVREGTTLSILDGRNMNVDHNRKHRRRMYETEPFAHALGGTVLGKNNRFITVSPGKFYYALRDIPHDAFDTSPAGTTVDRVFTLYYQAGGGAWTKTINEKEINNTDYDGGSGLVAMTASYWRNDWVYLNLGGTPGLIVVLGQAEYASLTDAKAGAVPPALPPIVTGASRLIGRVIIQKSASAIDTVESAFSERFDPAGIPAHNTLPGLDYAGSGHTGFLESAERHYPRHAGLWSIGTITASDGSITLPSAMATFYTSPSRTGLVHQLLSGATLAMVDGSTNHILADRDTSTFITTTTPDTQDNISKFCVMEVYRSGANLHQQFAPLYAHGEIENHHERVEKTDRYGIVPGGFAAMNVDASLNITMSGGTAFAVNTAYVIPAVTTATRMFDCVHVAGVWSCGSHLAPLLHNTQYDNGTDVVTMTDGYYAYVDLYRGVEDPDHLYSTLSNAQYASVDLAKADSYIQDPLPALISSHAFHVGRVIFQKNATTGFIYESVLTKRYGGAVSVTDHSKLTNLAFSASGHTGFAPTSHNQDATTITTGTLDGDRLPAMSTTKKGGVPATGTPAGLFLKDDGTWAAGGGGAPTTSKYLLQQADGALPNAQAMGALGTGITINTTTTGVQSIYGGTSCTNQFPRSLNASGAATCAGIGVADFTANQGTTTTLLHGNASGQPSWGGVSLTADATANQGTTTTFLRGNAAGQPSWSGISLTADATANQGTTTTVLHGNASGQPSWGNIVDGDISGTIAGTKTLAAAAFANSTTYTLGKTTPTSVTLNVGSDASAALVNTFNIANHAHTTSVGSGGQVAIADTTGTLAVGRGGTNLTAAAEDGVMVGNGTTWESKTVPSCSNPTTSKLLYDNSTNTFSCGTDAGGSGAPGGNANEVQYNNGAGGFAGAANVEISATGNLNLMAIADPTPPGASTLTFYSKDIANRIMPKWVGPSGVDMIIQPHIGTNGARLITTGNGTTVGICPSNVATPAFNCFGMSTTSGLVSTGGTFAQAALASTNLRTQTKRVTMTTGAGNGAGVYVMGNQTEVWRGNAAGLGGFFFGARWGMNTLAATTRVFVGLRDVVTAPTNIDYRTSTTPGKFGMAISANTGNWAVIHNLSGSAPTVIDLGATHFPASGTDFYELILFAKPNDSVIGYRATNLTTGGVVSGSISTNIPASTTFLSPLVHINNNAATTTVMEFNKLYLETDY